MLLLENLQKEYAVLRDERIRVAPFLKIAFGGTAIMLAVIIAAAVSQIG